MGRLLPLVIVLLVLPVACSVRWPVATPSGAVLPVERSAAPPAARLAAVGREPVARTVLRVWDRARARAWASGDPAGLRRLYVRGSRAGRADVAMLEEYAALGLVVRGLRTQLLGLRVLHRGERRLRLRVTDRVVGGEVRTTDGGDVAASLPVDRASTRVVSMRRVRGRWLVAGVRPAGR